MRRLLIGLMHLRGQRFAERRRRAVAILPGSLGLCMRIGVKVGNVPLHHAGIETRRKFAVIVQLAQRVDVDTRDFGHGWQVGIGQRPGGGASGQALGLLQFLLHALDRVGQVGQPWRLRRRF